MTRRLLIAAILVILGLNIVVAQNDKEKEMRLEQRLAEASRSRDSIPILYDLYDISSTADQKHYATLLYQAATNSNDIPARLEALRYLLNSATDPLEIFEYTRIAEFLPQSDDQWETAVFGRLKKYAATVPSLTERNRQDMLREAIKSYDQGDFADDKTEVEQLYKLCIFLNASTKGKLYLNYMNRLKTLLEKLPPSKSNALKNMFYIQLGIQALGNEDYDVALESVDGALKVIDQLEKLRYEQGRKYARYRTAKYTLLRRRLACFPILSQEEVNETYNRLKELARKDPSLMADFNDPSSRAKIYYYMATTQYAKAIPYLKKYLNAPSSPFRRTMLSYLTQAAEEVGDTKTMVDAMKEYNAMLQDYIIQDSEERYSELQILYDTHHLRAEGARADRALRESQDRLQHVILIISVCAAIVLAVFSFIIVRLYRRLKKKVAASDSED